MFEHSIGAYVDVVKWCAWIGYFSWDIFWKQGHLSIKCLTCWRWNFHVSLLSLGRFNGRSRPNDQQMNCAQSQFIYILLIWSNFQLVETEIIYSSEYSLGLLIMLSQHKRDRESAKLLSSPDIYSKSKIW